MLILISDFVVIVEFWIGGILGVVVFDINIFGMEINCYFIFYKFYYLVLVVVILIVWFYCNFLCILIGCSFIVICDSEILVCVMGINLI